MCAAVNRDLAASCGVGAEVIKDAGVKGVGFLRVLRVLRG